MRDLISVIMSVYNEENYIADAIGSILEQTYDNFELIIIDDCSKDKTPDIIRTFNDKRIRFVQNTENVGLTCNLNKALEMAKGTFIARMDSDDISLPERFERQLCYLYDHPEISLVSCQTETFGDKKLVENVIKDPDILKATMLIRPVLAHPGFMFRREVIEKGFRYDESFRQAQDYDFAARLTRAKDIAIVTPVLLRYRAHKYQVSSKSESSQFSNADRVRKMLLSELEIELCDKDWDEYHKFVCETKVKDLSSILYNVRIINRIIEANDNKKIYDGSKLEIALWNQIWLWVLRNKSLSIILDYRKICSNNRFRKKLFWIQVRELIKRKVNNRLV